MLAVVMRVAIGGIRATLFGVDVKFSDSRFNSNTNPRKAARIVNFVEMEAKREGKE